MLTNQPICITTKKPVNNIEIIYSDCKCCGKSYKLTDRDIGLCGKCYSEMKKPELH